METNFIGVYYSRFGEISEERKNHHRLGGNWFITYIVSIFALIVRPIHKDIQSRFHPILKIHRGLK